MEDVLNAFVPSTGEETRGRMFKKKSKKVQISAPSNFEHRVHTGFDHHEQK